MPLALGDVDAEADDCGAAVEDYARAMNLEAAWVAGRGPANDEQLGSANAADLALVLGHQRTALRGVRHVAKPGAEQLLAPETAHARESLVDIAEAAVLQDVDAGDGLLDDAFEGDLVVVQVNVQLVQLGHGSYPLSE